MIFVNTDIYIMKKSPAGHGYGADETEAWTVVGTAKADMQPYNGGLAQKEYGLSAECQKRLYTEPCPDITEGAGIAFSAEDTQPEYDVIYAEHWEAYTMAILKRRAV